MKNGLKFAALGVTALILLASCSAKETTGTTSSDMPAQSEAADASSRTGKTDFSDMTVGEIDKDAMPERPSGNRPEKGDGSSDGETRPEGKTPPKDFTMPEGFSAPEGFSVPEGKELPEGMSRPDFSGEKGFENFDKQFGGMDIEVKYTGRLVCQQQLGFAHQRACNRGALDSKTGEEVLKLFRELNDMGHAIIMITHDLKVAQHAQRVIRIVDGEIVQDA